LIAVIACFAANQAPIGMQLNQQVPSSTALMPNQAPIVIKKASRDVMQEQT
jgi:hypothetical protein